MFEARVDGRRVDERHEAKLAHVGQPAKLGAVDDGPRARGERHVDFAGNADHAVPAVETGDFGDLANGAHGAVACRGGVAAQSYTELPVRFHKCGNPTAARSKMVTIR